LVTASNVGGPEFLLPLIFRVNEWAAALERLAEGVWFYALSLGA